ncbi:MAG TPA: TolC family protein [Kofleriaceae bacterium]|nr:TolC family protein [Kofleriaceae bacterium]
MRKSSIQAIVVGASITTAAPVSAHAETLTLAGALARARGEQPSLRVARAQVEQSAAQIDQIDATAKPTVAVGVGVDAQATRPPDLFDVSSSAGVDVTGHLNLWDFGQRKLRRRAALASLEAIEWSARGRTRDVERQVAEAYWSALAREQLVGIAQATVAAEERHFDEAQRFVAADARASIDLAQVRSTLAQARLALVTAENEYAAARVALEQAMGVVLERGWDLADAWPAAITGEDGALDALVARVEQSSDELAAAKARQRAAEATVTVDAAAWRPALDATARAQASTPGFTDLTTGWSAGVTLSWSLWDGGARRATLRGSRAAREAARAEVEELQLRLRGDVENARVAVRGAKARQVAAAEVLAAAAEELRLAEARYTAGAGSTIEVADAQDRVTSASTEQVQAQLALARARTTLSRLLATSR